MPTPPSNAWAESSPAGSQNLSLGDDRIREMKVDVRERAQNGGHYYPTSGTSADAGIHAVQSANRVSGEWTVYESDLATKALVLTDTTCTINENSTINGTLEVTGALTNGGIAVVKVNAYRKILLHFSVDGARLETSYFYIPPTIVGGTLLQLAIIRSNSTGVIGGLQLYYLSPVWAAGGGDESTTTDTTTTAGTMLTNALDMDATEFAVRTDDFSITAVTAGDILSVKKSSGSNITGQVSVYLLLRADLP